MQRINKDSGCFNVASFNYRALPGLTAITGMKDARLGFLRCAIKLRSQDCGQYISLKDPLTALRSKRIKQLDKIKKLIIRLKGLRWRYIALLRFILVVDLLDLTAVDAQATWWQDGACHLVLQALEQRLGCLFRFQGERQIDHFGQLKESFGKTEAIWVQIALHSRLSHESPHGIMREKDPVEFLVHPVGCLGTQDFALHPLVRFDFVDHQFDLPTLMIEGNQLQSRSHPRIEQSRHQAIHLALFSQSLIGDAIGDETYPHAPLQGI